MFNISDPTYLSEPETPHFHHETERPSFSFLRLDTSNITPAELKPDGTPYTPTMLTADLTTPFPLSTPISTSTPLPLTLKLQGGPPALNPPHLNSSSRQICRFQQRKRWWGYYWHHHPVLQPPARILPPSVKLKPGDAEDDPNSHHPNLVLSRRSLTAATTSRLRGGECWLKNIRTWFHNQKTGCEKKEF